MKKTLLTAVVCWVAGMASAQTPIFTDGLIMPKKLWGNGIYYGYDRWSKYWEGSLKRDNGNIGTLTTMSATWMTVYGLTDKVTIVATLPYIWTKASGGTLHGLKGFQDVTFAAKYHFFNTDIGRSNLKFFALGGFSFPTTNYTPDFLPLSIGLGSRNIYYRLTSSVTYNKVWFATLSGAYTWRSNIHLARPSYYTNGQLYYTNEVQMPNVFDFIFRAGYHVDRLHAELYYTQQNTLGGGDIRRQDMPVASNHMNAIKGGVSLMYAPKLLPNIQLRAWSNYTFAGRNVGQSITVVAGAMYMLNFSKQE